MRQKRRRRRFDRNEADAGKRAKLQRKGGLNPRQPRGRAVGRRCRYCRSVRARGAISAEAGAETGWSSASTTTFLLTLSLSVRAQKPVVLAVFRGAGAGGARLDQVQAGGAIPEEGEGATKVNPRPRYESQLYVGVAAVSASERRQSGARYPELGPSTSDDRKEERCEGPRLTLAGGKGAKCVWEALVGAWVEKRAKL